jgi:LPXTG-motif cell wall-anchored protein
VTPAATGPTLPRTGTDTVGQAALGVGIVMLGLVLRRLTRTRRIPS